MKLSCLSRLVHAAIALNDSLTFTPFYGIMVGNSCLTLKVPYVDAKYNMFWLFSYYKFSPLVFFFFLT